MRRLTPSRWAYDHILRSGDVALPDVNGVKLEREREAIVDALAEKLDERLREWKPDTAAEARERIMEVIELADQDLLDVARSRAAEQKVLDLLDKPSAR
jgi:hypothetical protein